MHPMLAGLSSFDYATIVIYLMGMLWLGYHLSRRQKDTDEYFVAGRNMPSWAAGLSIFATLLSTIAYLYIPGEVIKHGIGQLASLLACPLLYVMVGFLVIPYFMRRRGTSAYEYLELHFGLTARLLATLVFLSIRLTWMGMVVFTASMAMTEIIGVPTRYTWVMALVVGLVAIIYTTMGGLRAVIWTDVVQVVILLGGAVFTVIYVAWDTGTGPIAWWRDTQAAAGQRAAQPLWSWDPFTRVSYGGMIVQMFFFWACTAASDQVAVARYFSTSSAAAARRSFALTMTANVVLVTLLGLCGMALYSFYQKSLPTEPDKVFPYFISQQLPRGLAGLVVAALFSAAMSSLDSGINAVATVIMVDWYRRLGRGNEDPERELALARVVTCTTGLLAVLICILLSWIPTEKRGNLTDMAMQTCTFSVGGFGGLFFIAMLLPSCRGAITVTSTIVGLTTGFILAFGHWIFDLGLDSLGEPYKFSWMWIIPSATVVTFVTVAVMHGLVRMLAPSQDAL